MIHLFSEVSLGHVIVAVSVQSGPAVLPTSMSMGRLMSFVTTIFISLFTLAVIIIITMVCYYRRRMKTVAGRQYISSAATSNRLLK